MSKLIELKIGEVARVGSRIVMCLPDINDVNVFCDDKCKRCCFNDDYSECEKAVCMEIFRTDNQNVLFAEVKSIDPNVFTNK